jgi:Na+-driven multidrug efflux pump
MAFTIVGTSGAIIVSASFQATGKPLPDLLIILIRMGIISIPLSVLSVYVFKLGMTGVFISLGIGNVLSFIVAVLWGKRHVKNLEVHMPL